MPPSVAHMHSLLARNAKILKAAWKQTARIVQTHLTSATRPAQAELQPLLIRNAARHPIHPAAALRQAKGRWYTTHTAINSVVRRFTTSAKSAARYDRASFPKSRIGTIVNSSTGRAPFATTLRPNLTGGTLGRTAGGYGFGGGSARYFSHTPAAPAQVVQNVSQAIRAFLLSGKRAQYDGTDVKTGNKRYKTVSLLQKDIGSKFNKVPKATPGSFIDFPINPTVTALTSMTTVAGFSPTPFGQETINTEGLIDVLTTDFSRSLKELSVILNDIKRLSALGDLPISYRGTSLRIHFPGCDAGTVNNLCDELGVTRGTVVQDEEFDAYVGTEIALLFPFASSVTPSEASSCNHPVEQKVAREAVQWEHMMAIERELSEHDSTQSDIGLDFEELESGNPWLSSPSGYESLHTSDVSDSIASEVNFDKNSPLEYQGFEGVYRFMEQCQSTSSRN